MTNHLDSMTVENSIILTNKGKIKDAMSQKLSQFLSKGNAKS